MLIFDAHCDTIAKILDKNQELLSNECHVDLNRMSKLSSFVQVFAVFVAPYHGQGYILKRSLEIIEKYFYEIEKNRSYICHCNSSSDIQTALESKKIAALLSLEGGDVLQGNLSILRLFYRIGVRSICLTWNHRNDLADGVYENITSGGLTKFGRDVVCEMQKLGMVVDLSHISTKGFWDVIEISKLPVIVSHSNAKALCSHDRNLEDNQMIAIKNNDGVIGINLYPYFIHEDHDKVSKVSIDHVIRHIEYICGVVGSSHVGIGADFDGIDITPRGINGVQDIGKLFERLSQLNYSDSDIKNISGQNFLRVFKNI